MECGVKRAKTYTRPVIAAKAAIFHSKTVLFLIMLKNKVYSGRLQPSPQ